MRSKFFFSGSLWLFAAFPKCSSRCNHRRALLGWLRLVESLKAHIETEVAKDAIRNAVRSHGLDMAPDGFLAVIDAKENLERRVRSRGFFRLFHEPQRLGINRVLVSVMPEYAGLPFIQEREGFDQSLTIKVMRRRTAKGSQALKDFEMSQAEFGEARGRSPELMRKIGKRDALNIGQDQKDRQQILQP